MYFSNEKAIYIQISEYVMEKILKDEWKAKEKILSVRDLGGQLEVNPNTVMRAYDLLQQQDIIFNKRGLGFYIHDQAKEIIQSIKKKQFIEDELPQFFKSIKLLGISLDEIITYYQTKA